jgi:hypothetical protein
MSFIDWFLKPFDNPQAAEKKSTNVREQAIANMRAARERIGDDEIQKMAESLRSESMKVKAEKARKQVISADKVRVAGHVKNMLDEDR